MAFLDDFATAVNGYLAATRRSHMKKILVAMALVVATAATLAQSQPKQPPQAQVEFKNPIPEGLRDNCRTAKPAQTLALGEGAGVSAVSQGNGYAKGACPLFLVEIEVAQSSKLLGIGGEYAGRVTGPRRAIGPVVPLSRTECRKYEELSAYYLNGADGNFAHRGRRDERRLGGMVGDADGNTIGAHCRLVAATSFKKPELTPGATYKVAFGAKVRAVWYKVKVVGSLSSSLPK